MMKRTRSTAAENSADLENVHAPSCGHDYMAEARRYFERQEQEVRDYKPTDRDYVDYKVVRVAEHESHFKAYYNNGYHDHSNVEIYKNRGVTPAIGDTVRSYGRYNCRGVDLITADGEAHQLFYRTPEQHKQYWYEQECFRKEVRGPNY